MAANTGIIDGGDILVYLNTGTVEVPVWSPAFHCTECSIEHSTELLTRKTKDTEKSAMKRAGEQTTTINVSGWQLTQALALITLPFAKSRFSELK